MPTALPRPEPLLLETPKDNLRSAGTKSIGKWAHVGRVYKDLCNKEEYVQFQCKTYLEEQQSAKTS